MLEQKSNILVVDDESGIRDSMRMLFSDSYAVHLAESGREAVDIVKKQPIDLVLLDVLLPEIDGIETLKLIKKIDDSIEVIMVTAVIKVGKAVEAIRCGAYDYLTKPFDAGILQEQVKRVLEKKKQETTDRGKSSPFEKIVGSSFAIREVFKIIDEVAQNNATVLITGESGTGKELVARAIHNRGARREKLFVALNCAAIPENLLESELFGHERGSFTGAHARQIGKLELANGGTLLLDEVSSVPLPMQAKLLRVIQEKEIERIGGGHPIPVDVRLIAATNLDLRHEVKDRKFREDLYYRLNVIPFYLPPLRERKEDIPLLISHFLRKYNREFGKEIKGFKEEAISLLSAYTWPGNIRELENLIERLVVLTKEDLIGIEKLPPEIKEETQAAPHEIKTQFKDALKEFEADFIRRALEKAGGKKSEAAEILGIHRNTLHNLEKKFKLNQ
ncbi:sigma-54-dependent Fis family transcriptional regulator [Candidatus Saganbacteria bacterium]|uniref:Sigma-54-dependent Fis family transcriptional regulator n=1 Tax=Candidatus Saganbacteria bacterium TaxID=2575572 RepID=A0A9D6YW46_UNCSA|nr:sigma-54-dependent Fis family transcriptional regulator [Candidatus Saganbacteria bacterium]